MMIKGTVDDIFAYMLTEVNKKQIKDGYPPIVLDKNAEMRYKMALFSLLKSGKSEEILAATLTSFLSGYESGRNSMK